ncbi:hypothetical protein ACOMHN_066844 [Nucella lapillus]
MAAVEVGDRSSGQSMRQSMVPSGMSGTLGTGLCNSLPGLQQSTLIGPGTVSNLIRQSMRQLNVPSGMSDTLGTALHKSLTGLQQSITILLLERRLI